MRNIEPLSPINKLMTESIVDCLHCGLSTLDAIRHVWRKLGAKNRKQLRKNRPLRRGLFLVVIERHRANIGLYSRVLSGNL